MIRMKPGRGPFWAGVILVIAAAVFGIIWLIQTISMGASLEFVLSGPALAVVVIARVVYSLYNMTKKNRN